MSCNDYLAENTLAQDQYFRDSKTVKPLVDNQTITHTNQIIHNSPSTCPLASATVISFSLAHFGLRSTQPLQMAGSRSSRKGSSASPKTTRKGKAAAPETESTSKSPKGTRHGKAAVSETGSSDFNHENYNIRSPERTKLLTKIKKVIDNAPVNPAFWACCQLADMNCLQDIAKSPQQMILVNEKPLNLLVLQCELLRIIVQIEVVYDHRHAHC
jgi:hypothetical protein